MHKFVLIDKTGYQTKPVNRKFKNSDVSGKFKRLISIISKEGKKVNYILEKRKSCKNEQMFWVL